MPEVGTVVGYVDPTISTTRPPLQRGPTRAQARNRLRDAITRLTEAQQRLASLEEASGRAHQQFFEAERRLSDARDALQRAEREAPARLAEAFVTGDRIGDGGPVQRARDNVAAAQTEVDHLVAIEEALAGEIQKVQNELRTCRTAHLTAVAELVTLSPEYRALQEQHRQAWYRLRSVRMALRTVTVALGGQMPTNLLNESQSVEPLEGDRVGFPTDAEFVGAWASAMAQLEIDADAELPNNV